jgi:hypothetical protein
MKIQLIKISKIPRSSLNVVKKPCHLLSKQGCIYEQLGAALQDAGISNKRS